MEDNFKNQTSEDENTKFKMNSTLDVINSRFNIAEEKIRYCRVRISENLLLRKRNENTDKNC